MGSDELRSALEGANQVDLTVTGRKSGNESTRPIWFVEEDDRLLLLPVGGSGSNWYRNVVQTPAIKLAADGADYEVAAETIEDATGVQRVVEAFGEKYGADRVKEYYPGVDAAVQVPFA
jgi:hypothetical protein